MKMYYEYDHEEIEAIADKFAQGEFVTNEELKLWYTYKDAVKFCIENGAYWENHKNQDSEVVQSIISDINNARKELQWIRTINTFPLEEYCKYYTLRNYEDETRLTYVMANKINNEEVSETEKAFIREYFEESDVLNSINHFRELLTPVHLRNWTYALRNPTEYHPAVSSMDATELYDFRDHYVYIESECTKHRWGKSYWISVDCQNTLYSLPVIKDFKEYNFEIGKFYKIKCEDEIHWGNKKKYVMSIEECSESEFMEKGLHQYATRY